MYIPYYIKYVEMSVVDFSTYFISGIVSYSVIENLLFKQVLEIFEDRLLGGIVSLEVV